MFLRGLSTAPALVLLGCTLATPPAPDGSTLGDGEAEIGAFGLDLSARDPSIDPGDDFFGHANGAWLERYELASDETSYGPLKELGYRSERRVLEIIEALVRSEPTPGTIEQKIADFYTSFMDVGRLDALGIAPLRPELERIAAIGDRAALVDVLAAAPRMDTAAPFVAVVSIDRKDPDRHQLQIANAGLGLPDRSFYLEERFADLRSAYEAHLARMLGFTGRSTREAGETAREILALETAIARAHWPRTDLRDRDKTYHPHPLEALEAAFPGYPWRRHLEVAGFDPDRVGVINLVAPSATAPLVELVRSTPLATWRGYLTAHLLFHRAALLGDEIDDANFAFFGRVLAGQPERRARWKRGVERVGGTRYGGPEGFGEAVGRLYVERWFPPRSKEQMLALVENLRTALRERIRTLDWMGPETRAEALAKLESFRPKVGYPDEWRDFSGVEIVPDDLMANHREVSGYWYRDRVERLGEPTDREEWGMTPQMVNAYYNPSFNEIVFPAAILQPPFFDPHADPAVNYGAIGAVIGHEMGHGFDDQGSKSDHAGVERDWWTEADRRRFEARTRRLVEHYAGFEPLPGHPLNAELTLGENIGDVGGVSMAHRAWRISLDGRQPPVLEGTTGDQRFFLSWAQVWRAKYRDAFLLQMIQSDPHSPARYRVNGVVPHLDAWYAAFAVEPGDDLYLPPDQRVRIW